MDTAEEMGIEGIKGTTKENGAAVLTLPGEAVEVIDTLVFRWRSNRKELTEAIRATDLGSETAELIEALASQWIKLGLADFGVAAGEGFGAKCHEGVNA